MSISTLSTRPDREKLTDVALYLSGHEDKLVILDEVQRMPELFQTLRSLIDKGRRRDIRAGRFLLLGSASVDLLKQSGESLAGRIAYVELEPFSVLEVNGDGRENLWVKGGFPDSFLANSERASVVWRENFIRTYLERDIPATRAACASGNVAPLLDDAGSCSGGTLNAAQLSPWSRR